MATLTATPCVDCRAPVPYSGVGRPRAYCDRCRPAWFPPLKEVPRPVSRAVSRSAEAHERKLAREAAARQLVKVFPQAYAAILRDEYRKRGLLDDRRQVAA